MKIKAVSPKPITHTICHSLIVSPFSWLRFSATKKYKRKRITMTYHTGNAILGDVINWHAAWLKYHVSRCIIHLQVLKGGHGWHSDACRGALQGTFIHICIFLAQLPFYTLIRSFSHQSSSNWGGCILFNSWRRGSLTALGQSWPICKLPPCPRGNAFSQDGWQLMWQD